MTRTWSSNGERSRTLEKTHLERIQAVQRQLRSAVVCSDVELRDQDLSHLARVCVTCSAFDVAEMYDPARGAWLGSKTTFRLGCCLCVYYAKPQREVLGPVSGRCEKIYAWAGGGKAFVGDGITFRNLHRPTCPDKGRYGVLELVKRKPHVRACVHAQWKQLNKGRHFLHEHSTPRRVNFGRFTSVSLELSNVLIRDASQTDRNEPHIRQTIRWMTSSRHIAHVLSTTTARTHELHRA